MSAAPELLEALELMLATQRPFAPKEEGGLGLEYTSSELTPEAWNARRDRAAMVVQAAIAKARGE